MSEESTHLVSTQVDGVLRIAITGEIDLGNAPTVQEELERLTADIHIAVVDLRDVTYIDSRGIRLLVDVSRLLRSRGGALRAVAPKETVAGGVLRLMHIEELDLQDA